MKVLIIGLGSIARKHVSALRMVFPDVSIYALRSSPDSPCLDGVINIYDIETVQQLSVDFVIVSNPTSLHKATIESLISYQIPLFVEKPVFDKLEGVQTLLNSINKSNIITYVACNLRFLDCLKFTKKFIENRPINEVNSYCGSYLPDWRPEQDYRKVYSSNKEMGGGVHIDLIHEIDYLYWLFGCPVRSHSVKSSKSSLKISAIDYANYTFSYPEFTANVVLNYYRRDPKRILEILTDQGTLVVDLLRNAATFDGKEVFASHKDITATYTDQIQFFVDVVLTKKQKFNSINEAYQVLKLCIAND